MSSALKPGDCINQAYTVESLLGAGAFAQVYLVKHRFLGKQALKAIPVGEGTTPEVLLKEARLLVDLSHPHIVRAYDANVCEIGGKPFVFITMQWSPKGTLSDLLRQTTRLPLTTTLQLGVQITSALAYTHLMAPPLLHRDIKPTNILVFYDGDSLSAKVTDYGLAATIDPETRLCHSGGTLAFAPPEMAWGIADERSDVYSIGVSLYRAVTGIHPFPLVSTESVSATREFQRALSEGRRSIVPPSRLLMRQLDDLDEVIMKSLSPDMFLRYRNAREFHAALSKLQASHAGKDAGS